MKKDSFPYYFSRMAKYALVIGIQKYGGNGFSDLKKPAADAEAIAQILEKHGDFVKVKRSPSRWNQEKNSYEIAETKLDGKTLEQEITEFFEQVGNNEALIYFSGHGYQIEKLGNKKGYLVTSNCTTETVATHGIALDDLNNLILRTELSSLVVLLDCCHAGSLLEKNLISSSLTVFNSKQNYFFATACRSHEKAYEGEEYSIFTDAVLKALKSPGRVRTTKLNQIISEDLRTQGQEPVFLNKGGDIILVTNLENPVAMLNLSPEEQKRRRDIENIIRVLSTLHFPSLDNYIEQLPDYIDSSIFEFWESFKGVVTSSLFHLYDKELYHLLNEFHSEFQKTLSFAPYYHQASNPTLLAFSTMGGDVFLDESQEEAWKTIDNARKNLYSIKNKLFDYLRDQYIEVDIGDCNKKAWDDFQKGRNKSLDSE